MYIYTRIYGPVWSLFCKKGTAHYISDTELAPFYKTGAIYIHTYIFTCMYTDIRAVESSRGVGRNFRWSRGL
jgi:hypothetical protein